MRTCLENSTDRVAWQAWGGKELDTTEPTYNRAQGTLLSALW